MAAVDELVLAVRTHELFARGVFQGLNLRIDEYLRFIFDPRNTRYIPRSSAETDPSWKQIIPYVVLASNDELLLYRRGKTSGESRLATQHSIGLGGHISTSDESIFAEPGFAAYRVAVERELQEEIECAPVASDRIVGVINDDSVDVGKVHFGIVHIWTLTEPKARSRETKIALPRWVNWRELRDAADAPRLETWSQFCVNDWEKLNAQPGWEPA